VLKVVTALTRPAGTTQDAFLAGLIAGARQATASDGLRGAVVSEVVTRLRGDLAADAFVEEWTVGHDIGSLVAQPPPAGGTRWLTREHVLKRPAWTSDPDARKVVGTAYRRDDFAPEAFFRYWREIHAPISARVVGLGGYVVSEVLARLAGTLDADAFVEQWWPDEATLDAAGTSKEVAIAWADVPNYAKTTGTFWSVREHVVHGPTYAEPGLLEV
jgi:uncharacterized protein (TIGR02118 family)